MIVTDTTFSSYNRFKPLSKTNKLPITANLVHMIINPSNKRLSATGSLVLDLKFGDEVTIGDTKRARLRRA